MLQKNKRKIFWQLTFIHYFNFRREKDIKTSECRFHWQCMVKYPKSWAEILGGKCSQLLTAFRQAENKQDERLRRLTLQVELSKGQMMNWGYIIYCSRSKGMNVRYSPMWRRDLRRESSFVSNRSFLETQRSCWNKWTNARQPLWFEGRLTGRRSKGNMGG